MYDTSVAKVNLQALQHNLQIIKRFAPNSHVLPMIKGNAYGHGLIKIGQTLSSKSSMLGVANIAEAIRLRENGVIQKIVVMRGFCCDEDLQAFFADSNLVACIHDQIQLELLKTSSNKQRIKAWLKLDTGMHRLGFSYLDAYEVYHGLSQMQCVDPDITVFTHLADADNKDQTFTQTQLKRFSKTTAKLPCKKSTLGSAGILMCPESAYEWVRPGVSLYGVSPFMDPTAQQDKVSMLKPVMTLESQLIAIKRVLPGETIGYNCTYRAENEMLIGVVGAGYGDGYPRNISPGTHVIIKGSRYPVVGRVSMDMITVDISLSPDLQVTDVVTLWGEGLSVNEVAAYANTIPHELLTQVTGRVRYEYLNHRRA